jgi:hypothetical protein
LASKLEPKKEMAHLEGMIPMVRREALPFQEMVPITMFVY